MITDIFNNSVDFGYSKRYSMLTEASEDNELLKTLVDLAEGDTAENGIFEKREIIADLLETKHNDTSLNNQLLNRLGIKDVKGTIAAINELKDDMVAEKIYNDLYGQSLTSKYRQADKEPEPEIIKENKPTQGEKDANELVNNAINNFNEAALFGAKTNLTPRKLGESADVVKVEYLLGTDYDYYGIDEEELNDAYDIFKNTDIKIGASSKARITGVNFDKFTKELSFKYISKKNIKENVEVENEEGETVTEERFGDLPDNTQNYNLSKPSDFKKLYMDRGVEISGTKASVQYENAYNEFEMNYAKSNLYRFILDTGTIGGDIHKPTPDSKFGDGSMHRWVSIVAERDPAFFTAAIENAITKDPALYNKLKDQYVKFGSRTMTVKALMVELQTKNL